MFKETVKRILFGFGIGIAIGQFFVMVNLLIASAGVYSIPTDKFIIQFFITGVIGAMFAGTSVIFDIEKWSLLKQTIVHFIFTCVVMFCCYAIAGWIKFSLGFILIWLGVFVIIYCIFWITFYMIYRAKVKKINESIEK